MQNYYKVVAFLEMCQEKRDGCLQDNAEAIVQRTAIEAIDKQRQFLKVKQHMEHKKDHLRPVDMGTLVNH